MNTRNRAWRRFQRNIKIDVRDSRIRDNGNYEKLVEGKLSKNKGIPAFKLNYFKCIEKNWKLVYTRKCKLVRAKQLGREYPSKTLRQVLDTEVPIDNKFISNKEI